MANIIQNTIVKDKIFTIKDNSGDNSSHRHVSSDIDVANKAETREQLGIFQIDGDLPASNSMELGDILLRKKTRPIAVSEGGTGNVTNFDTRQNLNLIGVNLIKTKADDTPENWASKGTGVVFMSDKYLDEQPSYEGFLHNQVYKNIVYQIWYSLNGLGDVFIRSGDSSGWHSVGNSWVRIHTHNSINRRIYTGSLTEGGSVYIRPEDLYAYTLFRIDLKGKGTGVLCVREGDYIRGTGGYSDSSGADGSATTYHVNCEIEDNKTLKCLQCNQITHQFEGGHDGYQKNTIVNIYGIV